MKRAPGVVGMAITTKGAVTGAVTGVMNNAASSVISYCEAE